MDRYSDRHPVGVVSSGALVPRCAAMTAHEEDLGTPLTTVGPPDGFGCWNTGVRQCVILLASSRNTVVGVLCWMHGTLRDVNVFPGWDVVQTVPDRGKVDRLVWAEVI